MTEPPTAPGGAAAPARRSPMPVPALLRDAAGWSWRLLLVAGVAYGLVWFLTLVYLVTLPFLGALFAASLVQPVVAWLRARGLPRGIATWLTVLVCIAVIGGIGYYIVDRAAAEYPDLVNQLQKAVHQGRDFLVNHVGVKPSSINDLQDKLINLLQKHQSTVAEGVVTGVGVAGEALVGLILWFFITFFLLYDGDHIWAWVLRLFPVGARERVHEAAGRGWARIGGYVRGTFVIAVFHGVVVAITLFALGVPLVAPLALLVFLGSFLPIVGAFLFGGLAVIVTLVTQGLVPAVILLIVLVVDNQIEAHLLQPFLVGRYVRLHPLAVAIAITGGGLLEGIYGAVLAVPVVAVVYAIGKYFATGGAEEEDRPPTPETMADLDEVLHPEGE